LRERQIGERWNPQKRKMWKEGGLVSLAKEGKKKRKWGTWERETEGDIDGMGAEKK
jgi:hypothetical protein